MKIFSTLLFVCVLTFSFSQTLGIYEFTGAGACPNQNPSITAQPANGVFSDMTSFTVTCVSAQNVYNNSNWETSPNFNPDKYNEFTLTANQGFKLNLDSLIFASKTSSNNANWLVRSSLDNYATTIFSGTSSSTRDTIRKKFTTTFMNLPAVTFRFYCNGITAAGTTWRIDDVELKGAIVNSSASVAELNKEMFAIFPNPSNDFISVESTEVNKVLIFASNGQVVKSFSNDSNLEKLDISDLEKGIYFVQIYGQKSNSTVKFIKN